MKRIRLKNSNKYVILDDSDHEQVSQYSWFLNRDGYAVGGGGSARKVEMQVFLLGSRKGYIVDHSNRNRLDNRRQNLRYATHRENSLNTVSRGGESKYKGVCKNNRLESKNWRACVSIPNTKSKIEVSGLENQYFAAIFYNILALYVCKINKDREEFLLLNYIPSSYKSKFLKSEVNLEKLERLKIRFKITNSMICKVLHRD